MYFRNSLDQLVDQNYRIILTPVILSLWIQKKYFDEIPCNPIYE